MTLRAAIAAFIATKCDRSKMCVNAWASTYRVGTDEVRAEWERQMTVESQSPNNAYETEGK